MQNGRRLGKGKGKEERRPAVDVPDQVRKLTELRNKGVLTGEEFESKKRDVLDRW
jgi:hypothetical protein